jgi:hypothetical protein
MRVRRPPKWDWKVTPCPVCAERALIWDGAVVWRSGSRPPRELATTGGIVFTARADIEIAHYFHCSNSETKFVDAVDSRRPYLHRERD